MDRVKEITDGVGVPVVYDPIGGPTYEQTLDCLAARGYFISFGTTGGPMPAVDPPILQNVNHFILPAPLSQHIQRRGKTLFCLQVPFLI